MRFLIIFAILWTQPLMANEIISTKHDVLSAPLYGTLEGSLGSGEPVVLIHPGSGPTDRDGNSPQGIKSRTYQLLAEELAADGISSIRIDKRGMFESAAAIPDANQVTVGDYVRDIESWANTIIARNGGGCVWLLGHSEGGLHAMAAAAKNQSRYCGLLLVASVGRSPAEVLRGQIASNPAAAPLLPQVNEIIGRLIDGDLIAADEMHPSLLPLFGPQVQGFVASLFRQEPAGLMAAHDLPVLILNGRSDLQTPDTDAEALARSRPDATLMLFGSVNHVLKEVPDDDRASNLATYMDPDLPLAPGISDAISTYVLANH